MNRIYREYREDTMVLIRGAFKRRATEEQFEKMQHVFDLRLFQTAVFELLLARYRISRKMTRRQMRQKMEEGTFWEDFLKFLQSIDWEKVLELVMKIVEMILSII